MHTLRARRLWFIIALALAAGGIVWSVVVAKSPSARVSGSPEASTSSRAAAQLPVLTPVVTAGPTSTASTTRREISAHAYLAAPLTIVRDDAGAILGRQERARWPLASITKLMAAAVILDRIPVDQLITIIDVPGAYTPSMKRLPAGAQYRADELMTVMLVESSNEAAESFAAAYGRESFIAAMNAQAAAWGMRHTHFDDPAGLSAASQSTAEDIMMLVRHLIVAHPAIFTMTQARTASAVAPDGIPYVAFTTNEFAGRADFLGGKTGYTDEAQGNLVSLFTVRGTPTAIVVLGSADRFGDTRALLGKIVTPAL